MSKGTILIVEDIPDVMESVRLLLEQNGFDVITVDNCSKAYGQLTLSHPNVILTDLLMPDMTGLEFIRWVRSISDFDGVPIVAMTAYDQNYLAAAIAAGADAAIRKPEGLDVLVETINQVLRKSNWADIATAG
jgi:CheY-like chemotaxis protein